VRAKERSTAAGKKRKVVAAKIHAHGKLVEAGSRFVGVSKKVHKNENAVHQGGLFHVKAKSRDDSGEYVREAEIEDVTKRVDKTAF
jgi:hypothetical protein